MAARSRSETGDEAAACDKETNGCRSFNATHGAPSSAESTKRWQRTGGGKGKDGCNAALRNLFARLLRAAAALAWHCGRLIGGGLLAANFFRRSKHRPIWTFRSMFVASHVGYAHI